MYAELALKKCNRCQEEKELSAFYVSWKRRVDGKPIYRPLCKECERKRHAEYVEKNKDAINKWRRERYRKNPERWRAEGIKYRYGITVTQYNKMYAAQRGCCAICKTHESRLDRKLDVDHCHSTNAVRGLLCRGCNRGIGFFEDDIERLKAAIKFLKKSKK